MKRFILSVAILLSFSALAVVPVLVNAQTATDNGCPAGAMYNYLTGALCSNSGTATSTYTGPTTASFVHFVGTPILQLKYDASHNESSLVSTMNIMVDGGASGVTVYSTSFYDQLVNSLLGTRADIYSIRVLTPPPGVTKSQDQYGATLYTIPAGQSSIFKLVTTYNPLQMFAGRYYANLYSVVTYNATNPSSQGTLYSVSANKSNMVTVIGEKSPYINSIDATASQVTIKGVRFAHYQNELTIDGKKIAILPSVGYLGTTIVFNPMTFGIGDGEHMISINHPITGRSNNVYYSVGNKNSSTYPTFGDVGSNFLTLNYDNNSKESSLTGSAAINITAGPDPITISNAGFNMRIVNTAGQSREVVAKIVSINKQDFSGTSYTISPNTTALFYVWGSFDPRQLFAGSYTSSLTSITFSQNGTVKSLSAPANKTTAVTIVGETSPYITSITSPVQVGQPVTIYGQRLNHALYVIVGNQAYPAGFNTFGIDPSPSSITFTPNSSGPGVYQVYTNAAASHDSERSNIVSLQIGDTTTTSCFPRNLTIGSRGDDVLMLQNYIQSQGYMTVTDSNRGYYEDLTKRAVAAFQASVGISPADGFFGPVSRAFLINQIPQCNGTVSTNFSFTSLNNSAIAGPADVNGYTTGIAGTFVVKLRTDLVAAPIPKASDFAIAVIGPNGTMTIPSQNQTVQIQPVPTTYLQQGVDYTVTITGIIAAKDLPVSGNYSFALISANLKTGDTTNVIYTFDQKRYATPTVNVITPNNVFPTITVTSPNGGENYTVGNTANITWTSKNLTTAVDVYYWNMVTGNVPQPIAKSVPNTGSYSWQIPSSLSPGSYKMYVTWAGGEKVSDTSDNNFTITSSDTTPQPSTQVISPNGGETWYTGQSYQIGYTAQNLLNNQVWVYIDKYTNGTVSNTYTVASAASASGKAYVTLSPDVMTALGGPGTTFKIRTWGSTNGQGLKQDTSDNYFRIVAASSAIPAASSATYYSGSGSGSGSGTVYGAATQCIQLTYGLARTSTDDLTGGEVSVLQQFLETQGATFGGDYGNFGPKTETAVKAWQAAHSIDQTGIVGPLTRAAIQNASCQ
jgi:peptidoglycan hydrolase-like protein with peptidoglycan-binding domain